MKKIMSFFLMLGFIVAMTGTAEAHGRRHKHHHGHRHHSYHPHHNVYHQPYYHHVRRVHRHFHGCGHAGYGVSTYNVYPYYYNQPGLSVYVGY